MKTGSTPSEQQADPADDRRSNRQREPIQTDVAMMIGGPIVFAIGYLIQSDNIPYTPGDYRVTPAYGAAVLAISAIAGVFLVVVGSIRLLQGLRSRRRP
jgi:hypothetical protein